MKIVATADSFNVKNSDKTSPSGFDILVELRAGAINPVDSKVRSTLAENEKVLGYDGSGVVVEIGSSVENLTIGDEVYFAGDISLVNNGEKWITTPLFLNNTPHHHKNKSIQK